MGRIVLSFGFLNFTWYGIIVALAVCIVVLVGLWEARLRREKLEHVIDLVLCGIPTCIITARLYYVAANWFYYKINLQEIPLIWHGGLAVHGALIGVVVVLYGYCRYCQLSSALWADIMSPGLALGLAVGQWANFFNQEGFGYPTELPWGIYIDFVYRPAGYEQFDFFQPTFLYESIWNLFIFLLLYITNYSPLKKWLWQKEHQGWLFSMLLLLYSLGRFYVEGMRLEGELLGYWRLAQVVSLFCVACAMFLLFWLGLRKRTIK